MPWRPPASLFVNYLFDLPSPFGITQGALGRFWSGWRLSGITRINAGEPFTVGVAGDPSNDGLSGDRPIRVGDGNLPSSERTVDHWFDTDAFTFPDPFTFGDSGRSILRGPGFQTWDIALSKRTPIADGHALEFRVQFFNAFNKANFEQPDATLGNSGFGTIFGARRAREIELALKYTF